MVRWHEVSQDLAESFGLDKAAGALVAQVLDNSPALAAGLLAGDVITQVDGNEVVMSAQVAHFIGAIPPEQSVVIQVVRNGESIEIEVVIGHLPKIAAGKLSAIEQGKYVQRIGLRVAALSSEKAQQWSIRNGIDIIEVDAGVAQELGLQVGDVITSLANQRITSVQQFVELAAALPTQRSISLRIVREGRPLFVAFRLNQ
jgi:serine protease Do